MNKTDHRPSRLRWVLLALLVVALAWGVMRALSKRAQQQEQASTAAAQLQREPVFQIGPQDIVEVQTLPLSSAVSISGSLKALQTATIKARVAGELRDFALREGQPVRAGEVIARVDSTEAQARLRQASQQAAAAQAQVDIARRTQDNNQALVQQGFISATALETSTANLAAAQANLQAALAAQDIASKALEDTVLRAPFTGQVSARLAQTGERVSVDARIADIVDLSSFELEVALAPAAASQIIAGQMAVLNVEGLAAAVEAEVSRINPSVQPGSRSILVYLQLPATQGMRQGLFAQGEIIVGERHVPALPLSAVRNDKPEPYVQILREGRVVHVPVSTGRQGKHGADTLVDVEGQTALPPGTSVLRATAGQIREGTAASPASTRP